MNSYRSRKWNWQTYSRLKLFIGRYAKPPALLPKPHGAPLPAAQTMPNLTNLLIGGAKKMDAAILFIDLVDFTTITSALPNETTLRMLNVIIPTAIFVVREWKGEIEKNTGDGIMAILGTETPRKDIIATDAVECALTIRYLMINDIQPALYALGLPPMQFRIGIDMGDLLIGKIGIPHNSFLSAIGAAANRAAKLQEKAKVNGICLGDNIFSYMPDELKHYCSLDTDPDWEWTTAGGIPYRYFHLNYDWPKPEKRLIPPPFPSSPPFQVRR